MMTRMTMNLKKDFILTSFNHRLFTLPAFCGLFLINSSPFVELSYYIKKGPENSGPEIDVLLQLHFSGSIMLLNI